MEAKSKCECMKEKFIGRNRTLDKKVPANLYFRVGGLSFVTCSSFCSLGYDHVGTSDLSQAWDFLAVQLLPASWNILLSCN